MTSDSTRYTITYHLLVGRGVREATGAKSAIEQHDALRLAGASAIVIKTQGGTVVTVADLQSRLRS